MYRNIQHFIYVVQVYVRVCTILDERQFSPLNVCESAITRVHVCVCVLCRLDTP